MSKTLKAAALAFAVLGASYAKYKQPEVLSRTYDPKSGAYVEMYQPKTWGFGRLDNFLGLDWDKKQGCVTFSNDIQLNQTSINQEVKDVLGNYSFLEENSKFQKGDERWSAQAQMMHEYLKNVPASERKSFLYEKIKESVSSHERDHAQYFKSKAGRSRTLRLVDIETLGRLKSISETGIPGLYQAESDSNLYVYGSKNAGTEAGFLVISALERELQKYDKYDLYHTEDLDSKVRTASSKEYMNLKKKLGIDY